MIPQSKLIDLMITTVQDNNYCIIDFKLVIQKYLINDNI